MNFNTNPKGIKQTVFNGEKQISIQDIRNAIPKWCFKKDEARFLVSVAFSSSLLLVIGYLAHKLIPLTLAAVPLWILYACINGTVGMGFWVLGHECGHGAFSNNKLANDSLGFVLHTLAGVPYFAWQWSHFVHHAQNSHIHEGETHVPSVKNTQNDSFFRIREVIGVDSFAVFQTFMFLTLGFPLYLLIGASGQKKRGFTSHVFVPNQLFPQDQVFLVCLSNLGLLGLIYLLYLWGVQTSFYNVMALYVGPYLIVNAWLTGITWLHHTDHAVNYYDERTWFWLMGALGTIDRNYPGFINALQFDIGSTHVMHHIFSDIPHYNAAVANQYVKKILGTLYIHDKKSITEALIESAKIAGVVDQGNGVYHYD